MKIRVTFAAFLLVGVSASSWGQDDADDVAKFEVIAKRYQSVLLRQPRRGTAFDLLYRHYLDAGKVDELSRFYEALTRKEPRNASAFLVFALVQERRGRDEDAIQAFAAPANSCRRISSPIFIAGCC